MTRRSRFGWMILSAVLAIPLAFRIVPAHAAMENYPIARLRMLDKVTARTSTFDVKVGDTVRFGQLYIKPRACRKAPPIEKPESAAFLQIWDVTPKQQAEWIFSGWMFASSPALSGMDHPIYDVWVLDCIGNPPQTAPAQVAFSSAGQEEFTSGIGFTSGVVFASSAAGAVGYSSGQIGFASATENSPVGFSSSQQGQVEFNSASTGGIGFTSGAAEAAPAVAPAQVTPNDTDDTDEDNGPQIAVPGTPDNGSATPNSDTGMPSQNSDTGGVDKGANDEVSPSSTQNPVY